jgi:long-chain acyl-CoA synthetase
MQQTNFLNKLESIVEIWSCNSEIFSDTLALVDDYSQLSLSYKELNNHIRYFAAALQSLGVSKGMHGSQFSENSSKWMVADQGILSCGAVNAVRGSQAPIDELIYIYNHSDSRFLVTDSLELLESLYPQFSSNLPEFVILLNEEGSEIKDKYQTPIFTFNEIIEMGKNLSFNPVAIFKDDTATIVYSSGTTGKPKGIVLSHGNIASQIMNIHPSLDISFPSRALNVLPVWHMYERTCEYYLLSGGCSLYYTNIRNFKKDLKTYKPHYLIGVPRLWASIYEGIIGEIKNKGTLAQKMFNHFIKMSQKHKKAKRVHSGKCVEHTNPSFLKTLSTKWTDMSLYPMHKTADAILYSKIKQAFGGCLIRGISGGGALAADVEDFYEAIDLDICVGYGLTETSPVLTIRKPNNNKMYSAGEPIRQTEIMIVDIETLSPLSFEQKGLVLAKGPQIMKGYYKDQESTDKVLLKTGWFITGDIGWLTKDQTLVLTGRLKDTIVLSNGENIEPECIEQALLTSPFIKQIVLVGQDKEALGALIAPNEAEIEEWARQNHLPLEQVQQHPEFTKLIQKELKTRVQNRPNYRPFERISYFRFLNDGFSIENGLMTYTAKIKKNEVFSKYKDLIEDMYA